MAIYTSTLSYGSIIPLLVNGPNTIEDDDYETFIFDGGTPGQIDVGDRFVGVLRSQAVNSVGVGSAGNPTVTAVFAIELISKVGGDGTATQLNFGPLQSGGGNAAIAEWAALGLNLPTISNNGTTLVAFDFPDYGLANPGAGAGIADAIDTFDNSTAGAATLAEFGFLGDVGEFWRTTGLAGIDVIANILLLNAANQISVNVTADNGLDSVVFNKHSLLYPIATALQGTGTFVAPVLQPPGHFDLSTDTDFVADISIVPEPFAVAVWGLLSVFGVLIGTRRCRD